MKQMKTCSNCARGIRVNVNNDILCRIKGVVSEDFSCARYKAIPILQYLRGQNYKCINCEFFIIEATDPRSSSTIGFCQLFTVRQFNGEQKNACTKFYKKSELIGSL